MATDRKVVIAVDETEVSAYAFTWALHNLLKKTDKVVVLTATPFVSLDFPSADIASGKFFLLSLPLLCTYVFEGSVHFLSFRYRYFSRKAPQW